MKHHIFLTMLLVSAVSQAQITSIDQISVGLANAPADGRHTGALLSRDGKVVAFSSLASNTTGLSDRFRNNPEGGVFVYDRPNGEVVRISDGTGTALLGGISGDGRFITYTQFDRFYIYANFKSRCYRYDRLNGTRLLISVLPKGAAADGFSFGIDNMGNTAYLSMITNADLRMVYVRNISAGKTEYLATTGSGKPIPSGRLLGVSASGDGKFVYFYSDDPRLPAGANAWSTYRKRLSDGTVELFDSSGFSLLSISDDNRIGAIGEFRDGAYHYDVVDFKLNVRFSLESEGAPQITPDGTGLLAMTGAGPLRTPARYDFATKKWSDFAISTEADGIASMNNSGTEIVTSIPSLIPGQGTLTMIDLAGNRESLPGSVSEGGSNQAVIDASASIDGRTVAFTSQATNLVKSVTGGSRQVYVRNRDSMVTTLGSQTAGGQPVPGDAQAIGISPNGRYLAYGVSTQADFSVGSIVVRDLLEGKDIGSVSTDRRAERVVVNDEGKIAFSLISNGPAGTRGVFYFDHNTNTTSNIGLDPDGKPWTDLNGLVWVSGTGNRAYFLRGAASATGRLMEWVPGQTTAKQVFKSAGTNFIHDLSSDGYSVLVSGIDRKDLNNGYVSEGFQVQNWKLKTQSKVAFLYTLPGQRAVLSGNGRYIHTVGSTFDFTTNKGWLTAHVTGLSGLEKAPISISDSGEPITLIDAAWISQLFISKMHMVGSGAQVGALRLDSPTDDLDTFLNFSNRGDSNVPVVGPTPVLYRASAHSWRAKFDSLKFQYRVNSGDWSVASGPDFRFEPTVDGTYTVECRAVDDLGNVDTTPVASTFIRDSAAINVKTDVGVDKTSARISVSTTEKITWTIVVKDEFGSEVERFQSTRPDKSYEVRTERLLPDKEYSYEAFGRAAMREVKASGTFRTKK